MANKKRSRRNTRKSSRKTLLSSLVLASKRLDSYAHTMQKSSLSMADTPKRPDERIISHFSYGAPPFTITGTLRSYYEDDG